MSRIIKLATSTALVVLGTFWIGTTPAAAEKTAEQIKCEEEGGTWSDKGNGNTFCFKKLPPMLKATGPSSSGTGSSKPHFAIVAMLSGPSPAFRYFHVAQGDSDGDGKPDEGILRISCTGGRTTDAAYMPREAGSGLATGKRQHQPVTFVKEWGPSTPQFRTTSVGYDVKKVEGTGARASDAGWTQIELADASLCADHAISTKGTGAAGRSADPNASCGDSVGKGIKVSASQNGQTLRHAINTKGTGSSGRSDAACKAVDKKGAPTK